MVISIKGKGEVLLAPLFEEAYEDYNKISVYEKRELEKTSKILKEIKKNRLICVFGKFEQIENLYNYIKKRLPEMLGYENEKKIADKSFRRNRKVSYKKEEDKILNSILIMAENDEILSFSDNKTQIPFLSGFCGINNCINKDKFILPLNFYYKIISFLKKNVFVEPVKADIVAVPNVLLPKSQETTYLFKEALNELKEELKNTKILDFGCGSGILSLLITLTVDSPNLYFTDILPEAVSTTFYNFNKQFSDLKFKSDDKKIVAYNDKLNINGYIPANMFDNIDETFDLIVFNAPWVLAKRRNRSEYALNDENQATIKDFFVKVKSHLNPSGKIIFGYSDNGGDKAVDGLNEILKQNNLIIEKSFSKRVQSYQAGRKSMKIFTYILKLL